MTQKEMGKNIDLLKVIEAHVSPFIFIELEILLKQI